MDRDNTTFCILLKDKMGYRDGGDPFQAPYCTVSKGELLVEMREEGSSKYRLYHDECVTLHVGRLDVSPLDERELEYLLAVEPPSTRLQEYLKRDEVKENLDLVVGDVVMFKLKVKPDAAHSIIKGVIRYIGPIEGKCGTHFGIEIQVSMTHTIRSWGTY